jgi:nitroreductase
VEVLMDLFEAIHSLRAIRRLKPDPIPDEVLKRILEAAIRAPSGGNRQPWFFLVVREAERRKRLAELWNVGYQELLKIPSYGQAAAGGGTPAQQRMMRSVQHLATHLHEAPVHLVVCMDTDGQPPSFGHGSSIFPAIQNLMLAARGLGIGTVLTTIHRYREADLKALLGIPDSVVAAALIPMGYPLGKFGAGPRKPLRDVTFFDHWGQTPAW